jgi:hypothetical protein
MRLICVGKKVLNLRHMIIKEEWEGEPDDPPPGVVRVTMEPGRVLHFSGDRAQEFLRGLGTFIKASSPPENRPVPPRETRSTTDDPPPSDRPGEAEPPDEVGGDAAPDQDRA